MFTWIDMLLLGILAIAGTASIILFLLGATLLKREEQAYQEGFNKGRWNKGAPRTNADKIREMSDEDLSMVIMCPYETAGEDVDIMPCIKETGVEGQSTVQKCYECCKEWLQKEDNGETNKS